MRFKNVMLAAAGSAVLLVGVTGCNTVKKDEQVKTPAIDKANMDGSVKPGNDFYHYANGAWLKNNPIPDEYSRYSAFEALGEENYKQMQTIMAEASADVNAAQGTVKQKIRDFYNTGMDTVKIEQEGLQPIQPELERIAALKTADDVQALIAQNHATGSYPLFYLFGSPDEKNSDMVIAQLYQGGLGLPDRDYYVKDDARSAGIRAEYQKHVARMFGFMGENETQAQNSAATVMQLETSLAELSSTRLELRNPQANYNKTDLAGLQKMAPEMKWDAYFAALGLDKATEINVGQVKFFTGMSALLKAIPVAQWQTYLRWNVINGAASYLSADVNSEHFAFYGTTLSGATVQKPRWKRVLSNTSGSLGEAVGQLYVEKYFPAEAKARMITLVSNLKAALKERISDVPWMAEVTKKEALAKLAKINVKVGYPDQWIDYTALEIGTKSYYDNVMKATAFGVQRELAKIGKPVDRTEWGMTPQTINAYYSPNMNEIVFPAAILQPPFFYLDADDAVNYGAIGVVIGHEMSHGFDDQGRQYDKEGNLHDWWTAQDAANFDVQTKALVEHFNNFTLLDSLYVDGQLTLGENIADLGGLNISYTALQKAMEGKDMQAEIEGFTTPQRFFLSYAQVWRNNIRNKELMRRLQEDVHSPGEARVNGTVYNVPAFYEAFDIQPEDNFYIPAEKIIRIW